VIRMPDKCRGLFQQQAGWFALLAALGLTVIGITAIATVDRGTGHAADQARWMAIAIGVMVVCILPHPRLLAHAAVPLAVLVTVVLIFQITPGIPRSIVPVINGTRRWINLQFMNVQTSELAKIAYILALAAYLRHRTRYRTFLGLLTPFVIMFIPVTLILLQPDLGTAMLFMPALLAMLLVAGARLRHMAAIVGLGALVVVLNLVAIFTLPDNMQLLREYQRNRIIATVSQARGDTRYQQDVGFQQHKSIMLVGAGGLTGLGEQPAATLIRFNRLPEDHNDMIFTVIVNRWGLVGAAAVISLYAVLIAAMMRVAARNKDGFARVTVVGFAAILLAQAFVNIGMAVGLLPIIGTTLPFISYGGSSLLASYAMIGLTLNFAAQKPAIIQRPAFEFEHADALFQ
jgi:rod shape determining protein RodA